MKLLIIYNRQYIEETYYESSNDERHNASKNIQFKSIENIIVFILELMKFYLTVSLQKPKLSWSDLDLLSSFVLYSCSLL